MFFSVSAVRVDANCSTVLIEKLGSGVISEFKNFFVLENTLNLKAGCDSCQFG